MSPSVFADDVHDRRAEGGSNKLIPDYTPRGECTPPGNDMLGVTKGSHLRSTAIDQMCPASSNLTVDFANLRLNSIRHSCSGDA
jgi:hypothetical protein